MPSDVAGIFTDRSLSAVVVVSSSGMVVLISHDADENGEDGPATVENGKLSRSGHMIDPIFLRLISSVLNT